MINAKVLVPLNIRTGKPEILPNNNTGDKFYNTGETISIEDSLIGETYKDINVWYKLSDGSFVWSGGVDGFFEPSGINAWWLKNSLYSLPELWTITSKTKVKIAILDTGISNHIDFDFSKIDGFNYIANHADFKTDIKGHGTHCAGIIASQGKKIFGIAPNVHLFIAKVCDDFGIPNPLAIKNALTDIFLEEKNSDGISIINMSFGMIAKNAEENEIKKEIQALIQKISKDKKILMIASSGSIDDHRDSYPSSLPECISVGCLTSNFQRHPSSRKTSTLDIMAPGDGIFSLIDKENISKDSGTSQAAAFISGVCALILEKFNSGNINLEEVKNKLYETAFSESFIPEEFGNGIVNPNKLFNALKKI